MAGVIEAVLVRPNELGDRQPVCPWHWDENSGWPPPRYPRNTVLIPIFRLCPGLRRAVGDSLCPETVSEALVPGGQMFRSPNRCATSSSERPEDHRETAGLPRRPHEKLSGKAGPSSS